MTKKKYKNKNMVTGTKKWMAAFCLLLISGWGVAQKLEPLSPKLAALQPVNIFPDSTLAYRFSDRAKALKPSTFVVSKLKSGSAVLTAEVFTAGKSHYEVQSSWRSTAALKKGDALLARFTIRGIYAKQESGEAVVYFYVQEDKEPHTKFIIVDISAGLEWKTIDVPFTAIRDMQAGETAIAFSFGALPQKVEIASVQVLNFEQKTTLAALPTTKFTYGGREAGAAWRKEALQRIEDLRTAPLTIKIVDAKGNPVSGATVSATMVQSEFIWGTAVKESLLANDLPDAVPYRRYLKELFNTAVIENGFKAARWYGQSARKAETMGAFQWLLQSGLRQRGHNLVWPGWKFNPQVFRETAEKDTAAFRQLLETDIRTKMAVTKGHVIAWDVVNEYVHENDFFKVLPTSEVVRWYQLAKELDPAAQLFFNEYAMLNSVVSPKNIQEYIDTVMRLRTAGAPIEAIGVQGHVGRQPRNPAQIITDLNLFKPLGLPVQITEFDINSPDEALQADYTRDFLIACYSHPVVTGFTNWGFWESAHWKPDAAMFRKDWSAKPNAAVWREWVTGKWKTSFNKVADKNGIVTNNGHLGRYEITVKKGAAVQTITYQLTKTPSPIVIKL